MNYRCYLTKGLERKGRCNLTDTKVTLCRNQHSRIYENMQTDEQNTRLISAAVATVFVCVSNVYGNYDFYSTFINRIHILVLYKIHNPTHLLQ